MLNNILFYFSCMLVLHSLITQEIKGLMWSWMSVTEILHKKTLELDVKESAWICHVLLLHVLPFEKTLAHHCVPNNTVTSPTQMICVPKICFKIGKPRILLYMETVFHMVSYSHCAHNNPLYSYNKIF